MKTYINPTIEVIELETTRCVMETSAGSSSTMSLIDDVEVSDYYSSRNRGEDWSAYEGR
jgi:hypothetical protein